MLRSLLAQVDFSIVRAVGAVATLTGFRDTKVGHLESTALALATDDVHVAVGAARAAALSLLTRSGKTRRLQSTHLTRAGLQANIALLSTGDAS